MKKTSVMFCVFVYLAIPTMAVSQEECGSVKECAQEMVNIANELRQENAALLLRIEGLEKALEKHAQDAEALEVKRFGNLLKAGSETIPNPGGNGASEKCPAGYYMVGARWRSDPGGPHGILSWIGPICRRVY